VAVCFIFVGVLLVGAKALVNYYKLDTIKKQAAEEMPDIVQDSTGSLQVLKSNAKDEA